MINAASAKLGLQRLAGWLGVLVGSSVATWLALSPRPDWHDAPIRLFPLRFRGHLGHLGIDTLEHLVGATLVPLLLIWLLRLPRSPQAIRRVVLGLLVWASLIEIAQGVLPYRTFELSDIVANLVGCGAAAWLLSRSKGGQPEQASPSDSSGQATNARASR